MTATATPAVERVRIPAGLELLEHQEALIVARYAGHRNRLAVWHRQAGKDQGALVDLADAAVAEPGLYAYVGPTFGMIQRIAWDGVRASDGLPYLSVIPPQLVVERNEAEMALTLLTRHPGKHSRILFLSGDQPDRLRGLPLKGVVFTEWAQFQTSEALDVVRPALVASSGWLLILSTPLGLNHFHQLYTAAKDSPDWWVDVRTFEQTRYRDGRPMIAREDVERELRNGQRPEWIAQEYRCQFVVGLVASIFGDVLTKAEEEGRILDLPQRPDVPSIVAFDLGLNDSTVAIWAQESGPWLDVVDVEAWQNLSLPGIIQRVQGRGWTVREWLAPHDLRQRDLSAEGYGGQVITREQVARRLGIRFRIAPKLALADGLDAVRRMFSRFRFDGKRCVKLLEALSQYQRVWDPQARVYSERPLHNWCSDFADSLRTLATGYRERPDTHPGGQRYAKTATDYGRAGETRRAATSLN